ncbi:MAG: cytochrome b/b6 domain-containing protein [Betaproteobacteria bacterium]
MNDTQAEKIEIAVWDWPVRVVHWSLVALVATSITTGLTGGEATMVWHMRAGETLLALVLFRILWGFVGSRNARFTSFLRGPAKVTAYLKSVLRPPRTQHAAHNPIGGWMVVALLVALLAQCCLGLFTHDEVMSEGPLVKLVSENLSDVLSWLHRRGWWVVAGLASVHIVAVTWYFVALDENIVYPMVSGTKKLPPAAGNSSDAAASTSRALMLLALCALAVWWTVNRL